MPTPPNTSHVTGEPPILYSGTPVVLISSINEDGSANLATMSSAFWLSWRCILGLATASKTTENLKLTGEAVLNLPSSAQVDRVDRIALTTGSDPVPKGKQVRSYRTERHKFETAGFHRVASETVVPPHAAECLVQMEAVVEHWRDLAERDPAVRGRTVVFEVRIQRVHLARSILKGGDPDQWRPLIMKFAKFYGLEPGQLMPSTLASVPEALYRSPEVDRASIVTGC